MRRRKGAVAMLSGVPTAYRKERGMEGREGGKRGKKGKKRKGCEKGKIIEKKCWTLWLPRLVLDMWIRTRSLVDEDEVKRI